MLNSWLDGDWMKCLLMDSSATKNSSKGVPGRRGIRIAGEANASSTLQLVGCTDYQAVVGYTAAPAPDCICDVELHESRGT